MQKDVTLKGTVAKMKTGKVFAFHGQFTELFDHTLKISQIEFRNQLQGKEKKQMHHQKCPTPALSVLS